MITTASGTRTWLHVSTMRAIRRTISAVVLIFSMESSPTPTPPPCGMSLTRKGSLKWTRSMHEVWANKFLVRLRDQDFDAYMEELLEAFAVAALQWQRAVRRAIQMSIHAEICKCLLPSCAHVAVFPLFFSPEVDSRLHARYLIWPLQYFCTLAWHFSHRAENLPSGPRYYRAFCSALCHRFPTSIAALSPSPLRVYRFCRFLMFQRSFIRPYACTLADLKHQIRVSREPFPTLAKPPLYYGC